MAIVVIGKPFNKITGRSTHKVVRVRCECGKEYDIEFCKVSVRKSCGCKSKVIHGCARKGTTTKEYRSWCALKSRCENPLDEHWLYYGGRGITVCDRWQEFDAFLEDMGLRPKGTSIERIDNDLGYSPENCKWATKAEQARNRRSNTMLTIYGKTMCLARWLEVAGDTKQSTVSTRLRRGWTAKEAIFGKAK